MSLEEKLKEYMTETPVPEMLRPENIMSHIQPKLDALPAITDEESFFGKTEEISAIEFLTKLRRMGLSAEDFANLLLGTGASAQKIKLIEEKPNMSADELCDFLDDCGFTAQDYTKMLYLARKLWLQTQSLEHLDTELALRAKSAPEELEQNFISEDRTQQMKIDISDKVEASFDNEADIDDFDDAEAEETEREYGMAEPEQSEQPEEIIVDEAEEPQAPQAPEQDISPEVREEKPRIRPISRIQRIIEKVDDTVIIDGDELEETNERYSAELEAERKEAQLLEKDAEEAEKQAKTLRRGKVMKAFSAAAAALVILFGGYEYMSMKNGTDPTESTIVPQIDEMVTTYDTVYNKLEELKTAALARTDGSQGGYASPLDEAVIITQNGSKAELLSESDILHTDGGMMYYLSLGSPCSVLNAVKANDGKAELVKTLEISANDVEMAMVDDGICLVYTSITNGNTIIRVLDKSTLVEKRSIEVCGKPEDIMFKGGMLTLVTRYSPNSGVTFTSADYDSYLPFYSADGKVKYVDADKIHLTESATEPVYTVVAKLEPSSSEMLSEISACMIRTDEVVILNNNVIIVENAYPSSVIGLWNEKGYFGSVLLDGTVREKACLNYTDDMLYILTCLSTASHSDKTTLYIFNEKLESISRIENIASGETFKTGYIVEKTAFVITERETHPLFMVVTTDPKAPVITGELEEYDYSACFNDWDEQSRLSFGFGLSEDGTAKSLKLLLSEKGEYGKYNEKTSLSVSGTVPLSDSSIYSTEAEYEPDALYMDKEKSLIGFMYTFFDGISMVNTYTLVEYKDGNFNTIGSVNNYDLGSFRRGTVKDGTLYAFTDTSVTCADITTMMVNSETILNVKAVLS